MLRSTILLGSFLLLHLDGIAADREEGEKALRRRAADAETNDDDNRWIPEDPEAEGYFNYHPLSRFGPSKWGSFSPFHIKKMSERKYWKYYRDFVDVDLMKTSAIRDRQGKYYIDEEDSEVVSFEILDSKLRINYAFDDEEHEAFNWGGPNADIPKGWGGQLPVLHIDMKVPSEHTIDGKRFPLKYQIFLLQNLPAKRGAPVVTVLFDLHPEDKPNEALQVVLDEFQQLWDEDKEKCNDRRHERQRHLASGRYRDQRKPDVGPKHRRQKSIRWDAFDEEIVRSVWFWGYEGSLTEPPCSEFLEYRVIDAPALLSRGQLQQIESLLFERVDPKRGCRKVGASIANNGNSVARPTQPTLGRDIYKCNCRDYISDSDRLWYGRNRCWDGDQFVFHEEIIAPRADYNRVGGGGDSAAQVEQAVNWITTPDTKPDRDLGGIWNCYHNDSVQPPCCGGKVKNKRYGCD